MFIFPDPGKIRQIRRCAFAKTSDAAVKTPVPIIASRESSTVMDATPASAGSHHDARTASRCRALDMTVLKRAERPVPTTTPNATDWVEGENMTLIPNHPKSVVKFGPRACTDLSIRAGQSEAGVRSARRCPRSPTREEPTQHRRGNRRRNNQRETFSDPLDQNSTSEMTTQVSTGQE